jgi:PAS domain S-box-containing protein
VSLGKALGAEESTLRALRLGGYLHDLGKIVVPDRILLKPGPLDREELERMKIHPVVGADLVQGVAATAATALNDINRLLTESLDPDEVSRRMVAAVRTLLGTQYAALHRVEPTTEDLVTVAASAPPESATEWIPRIPAGVGLIGLAVRERQVATTSDLLSDVRLAYPPDIRARLQHSPFRAALAVPLLVHGRAIGVLVVRDVTARSFDDEEAALAGAFAGQAALALENAHRFAESEARRRMAEALAEVGRLLLETADPPMVGQRIADSVRQLLNALAAAVYRVELASGDLTVVAVSGDAPAFVPNMVVPRQAGVVGRALAEGRPIVTPDLLADPGVVLTTDMRSRIERVRFRAVLAIPLLANGRVVGAVGVGDHAGRVFQEHEIRVVQAFADQAALAFQRAASVAQLAALVEINRVLNSTLDYHEVAEAVIDAAHTLLPGCGCYLWEVVPGTDELRVVSTRGFRATAGPRRLQLGQGLAGLVAQSRERTIIPDLSRDGRRLFPEWMATEGLASGIFLPLTHGGSVYGTFSLFTRCRYEFSAPEVCLLESFAAQAAAAMANARLYDESERRRRDAEAMAEALRESEARYRELVEGAIQGVWIHNDFIIRFANAAAARIFGVGSPEELVGRDLRDLVAPREHLRLEAYKAARERGGTAPARYEFEGRRVDGTSLWLENVASVVTWNDEPAILCALLDITEVRQLEEQLREAQKLEAIGQLAGGVAHDFNNVLAVIKGRSDLLLRRLPAGSPARRDVELIQGATERAVALTRQLLAFGRKQLLRPRIFDLNILAAGISPMLDRLIGENITLTIRQAIHGGYVNADPTQLELVLINLVVNARDAMPSGGHLTIETEYTRLDATAARECGAPRPGSFVVLSVSDTGCGMDEVTLARIFEPFFTTKPKGKGTGLGLASAYGIVKQSGGFIEVNSAVGRGTTFRIYLPRVEAPAKRDAGATPELWESRRGTQTILVVDDDADVRDLACELLESGGYTVLSACNGEDALGLSARHLAPIHLLLTDVVMPGMNGFQLAQRLAAGRPTIKRLFMSGYTDTALGQHGPLPGENCFVEKPFTADRLTSVVQQALEAPCRA